jgi:hypothetical protein
MNTNALIVLIILSVLIFMIVREVRNRRSVSDMRTREARQMEIDEFEHYREKLEWLLSNQTPRVALNDPKMLLVYRKGTELNSVELSYWQEKIKEVLFELGALDTKTEAENAELEGVRQNQAHLNALKKPFADRRAAAKAKHSKVVRTIEGF